MEATDLKISVVIPTCHRNDLLAKCLDCLAPGVQTLPADQYEVIVTDDGSRSTAEKMVAEHYPWAKWTQGPQKGPAANRNHGASLAAANWLAFTDDDCLCDSVWLGSLSGEIENGARVVEGRTISRNFPDSPYFEAPWNEKGGCLWSCNFAISSELFKSLGAFDEMFPMAACEDVDLRKRIEKQGIPIVFSEHAVVDHPARPLRPLQRRRQMHISEVLLALKHGEIEGLRSHLSRAIVQTGLRQMKRKPLSIQSYRWAFECVLEALLYRKDFKGFVCTSRMILENTSARAATDGP